MNEHMAPVGRFLAVVDFLNEKPNRFARLRPLQQVDGLHWQPVHEGDARFPDEGLVFWWQPPSPAERGTFWVVTLALQLGYGRDQKHRDRFQVTDAWSPFQAVALHGVNGPRSFRRTLASGRLWFGERLVGRPLVRVVGKAGRWVALPDGLVPTIEDGLTLVTVKGLAGVVPVYQFDSEAFFHVPHNGGRYSLLIDPGVPDGYLCTSSDVQLVEHLRKRISTLDKSALEAIGVTRNALRQYVETIEAAGLGGDEAAKEEARRDAAETMIEGLEEEAAQIESVVDVLMKHPRVSEPLDKRIEDDMRASRERWERETADDRKKAAEQLNHLRHEIKAATDELDSLHSSIDVALRDIIDAPVEALVRHGLLDALRRSMPTLAQRPSVVEATIPPASDPGTPNAFELESITDAEHLKAAVTDWAFGICVDPYMLQVALAAVVGHRVTLMSGTNAERLAIAIASTVAGDHSVRVSLGTAIFGLGDVMQSPVTAVGSTRVDGVPTLGRFLATLTSDEIAVVILSGCNRAPPEVVLPEFLPTLDYEPSTLAWSSGNGSVATVTLSSRVRIIGTLHDGTATYPVPTSIGEQVGLVPADHRELVGFSPGPKPTPRPARLAPVRFDALQTPSDAGDVVALAAWLRKRGAALPPSALTRILSTHLNLLSDTLRAPAEALAGLLLGRPDEPDLADLPGAHADAIRERLTKLMDTPAWRATRHHFDRRDER